MQKLDPGPFIIPMPVVIIGADINGKPNFMTAAFVGIVNFKPPMVACGINPTHRTSDGIVANKAFSICVPTSDMVEAVDWCGIASGHKQDKSAVFQVFRGELAGAPMIEQCALCAECRLVQTTPHGLDTTYVAEIVSVYAKDKHITNDKFDWSKVSPLLFTFPDSRYWKLGSRIAKAWQIGKDYKAPPGAA